MPGKTEEDNEDYSLSFFLMPIDILQGIHDELKEVLGPIIASSILFRSGSRSGRSIVSRLGLSAMDSSTISSKLPDLWIQLGLGIFELVDQDGSRFSVRCLESNEAKALGKRDAPSCHLTRGYLAGIISSITTDEYDCIETSCISNGDNECFFELTEKTPTKR